MGRLGLWGISEFVVTVRFRTRRSDLDGRMSGFNGYPGNDRLLTQAPAEGLVKLDVTRCNASAGLRVVDQISIYINRVADQNTFEGGVGHLEPLLLRDVDIGWASEDTEVTQIQVVTVGHRNRYSINAIVVSHIIRVTCCPGGEFLVAHWESSGV